ncbi:uncharacterized protein Dana_GF18054, isoform C [Drosophila ananassae]|uniref:Uncharacterized protein, isoform B n=1 Tax=Drosophila ananassae TaxID=7217 RepID=A0A0N8P1F7_DROAN|nr:uncharacterized protein LOC6500833 isoform X1 [Drosophila ananassae]XP_014766751.1 uncharacterized protein LOC6500833 isoform X1 [Drosophila ananassae]KPU79796.1 uncharacterized protein Dana_GF18054, isoform B [Drosophila ananassae]KPU79797.1 uncharacterized protein Dana_GF18054, isoform C [Drosophila ananassae]
MASPSIFYILFWRLAVQVLYPYAYMDCSLQDALANEQLVWSKGDRLEQQMLAMMRESFRTTIMLVMMMEMMHTLDAALNLPIALIGRP